MKPFKDIGILADDQKGYLLIEALIAMAIFAIGFLAVGSLVIHTTRNNTRSNMMTQATLLAAHRLERFKNTLNIASLDPGIYTDPDNPIDADGNPGGVYYRFWEITDPLGNNSSRRIKVTVKWLREGRECDIFLTTITGGRGI